MKELVIRMFLGKQYIVFDVNVALHCSLEITGFPPVLIKTFFDQVYIQKENIIFYQNDSQHDMSLLTVKLF